MKRNTQEITTVKLICPRCNCTFPHPAKQFDPETHTWPKNCPSCREVASLEAQIAELKAALTELGQAARDGIAIVAAANYPERERQAREIVAAVLAKYA